MSKWDQYEAFVKVVEHKGFSAAADKMEVSKSYISRQISGLENRLGAQLLNRTTRKVTLTELGGSFYSHCKDLLGNLEFAEQAVMDMQARPIGTLRITAVGVFAEDYVVPVAIEYMKAYPDIRVDIDFSDRAIDLVAEGFDLAIRSGVLPDSSLKARKIVPRNLKICASPHYLSEHGIPGRISDLHQHNCLVGSNTTWRIKDDEHHYDFKVEGSWRSNNGRALKRAALSGLGIVQLPELYLRDDIEAGRLRSILDKYNPVDPMYWAVYPYNRHLATKVRLFIDLLVNRLT